MAVYTEVDDEALFAFVSDYDIGNVVSCKGIAEGRENSNYLLHTEQGPFILTLYEKRVNPSDLPFFLGLMQHLAETGVKCPVPVVARDGVALRTLAGRPAAIITFLQGVWPRRTSSLHCAGVGRAMADMHDASKTYAGKRANTLSINDWRPLYDSVSDHADDVTAGLSIEIEAELAHLEATWPKGLPTGVIHADLFPDNIFFLADKISGIIDFYFACTDYLAYDIAVCLNAWCFEPDAAMNVTKTQHLLAGYEDVRPLTHQEKTALPILARGAALRFLLTRLYDWINTREDALVQPKNPAEYLHKLRFHQGVKDIGAYGLS
ncbi:MAG: homoserine kinase [Rhodospirillaceae bacterium]|jgi:homoserine kinase type II|nr:homoserine kinase [Rhodospirillaceae bacterium]MBT5241235.1 homoserine kinase [Rhodospirillaceae bacterium]MBT5565130.1 homoserine kinase [Rhodospirillaceae bacterium]MBT6088152.1 homoserine kinase [Rhodospirillaceae bacterium]